MAPRVSTCPWCGPSTELVNDPTQGLTTCYGCGYVLEENAIIPQIAFAENENGRTSVVGTFVSADRGPRKSYMGSSYRDSREASLDNAKRLIQTLASALKLNQHQVDAAQNLFKLALHHNFSRGRRSQNVIASCVYIVCRRDKTPRK
jgi:transcription factor IIIB subunit 2